MKWTPLNHLGIFDISDIIQIEIFKYLKGEEHSFTENETDIIDEELKEDKSNRFARMMSVPDEKHPATLQEWIEWAESIDAVDPSAPGASEYENQADQYDIELISSTKVLEGINYWRQDQGDLFDEETDIPRLLKMLGIEKKKGDEK